MRVYLDQRIKFWMALMGLFTLMYVQFMGGGKNALIKGKKAAAIEMESNRAERVVVLHRSAEYNSAQVLPVRNAKAYSESIKADFVSLDRLWGEKLSKLLEVYPKGMILVDGTSRGDESSPIIEIPLDGTFDRVSEQSSGDGDLVVAVLLNEKDAELVRNYCHDPLAVVGRGEGGPVISAVRACSQAKPDAVVRVTKSGVFSSKQPEGQR